MNLDDTPAYPSQEEISRDRIMDACVTALGQHGLQGLRHKHIIELSGLSKQTIYNHYKNRDEILVQVFAREGERLSAACASQIRNFSSIEDKFVMGLLFVYDQLPQNPLLAQIVSNHHEFLATLNLQVVPMKQFGSLCFAEVLKEYPALEKEFTEIAEYWSRSVFSLLLFGVEQERSRYELEAYVRRRLVPGLGLQQLALE